MSERREPQREPLKTISDQNSVAAGRIGPGGSPRELLSLLAGGSWFLVVLGMFLCSWLLVALAVVPGGSWLLLVVLVARGCSWCFLFWLISGADGL